ncbi:hypothetical protein DPMN_112814 [Dreissena polymorpha]|uniref:Uncharacterized protein n=1 Tax=Dreissena polymorpha TaxID=45954 RepID=A0A9D4QR92_DREPO|nr:hypothetical protein DPMN_112814 [Dreissena polymorpha]
MSMNLIINPANKETRGPKTSTGLHLPTNRGFMDDLTVTTQPHIQAKWVLKYLRRQNAINYGQSHKVPGQVV